jgi:hypothetical protein
VIHRVTHRPCISTRAVGNPVDGPLHFFHALLKKRFSSVLAYCNIA